MNESTTANVTCPFYKNHNARKSQKYITCEQLMEPELLGFNYEQRTGFKRNDDMKDYMGLFCTDLYDECPIYKAIMQNRKEQYDKTKEKRKIQLQTFKKST